MNLVVVMDFGGQNLLHGFELSIFFHLVYTYNHE